MVHLAWPVAVAAACMLPVLCPLSPQSQEPAAKSAVVQRYEAVKEIWQLADDLHRFPAEDAEQERMVTWSRRLADAAVAAKVLSARDALAQHLARLEKLLADVQVLSQAGRRSQADLASIKFHVADARLALEALGAK